MKSYEELERLVVEALGGMEQVIRIAHLPDLPSKLPDTLRELARYIVEEDG